MTDQFKEDVKKGLSSAPKFLSSKYFYDAVGDDLFKQIMKMPEYYLTKSEFEIFHEKSQTLIDALDIDPNTYFELIELGAGDGTKTKELLKSLIAKGFNFDYFPIDISQNALNNLQKSLNQEIPGLRVVPKQGDYFEVLHSFKDSNHKKAVLFLGSNIGNLTDDLSAKFIYQLGSNLKSNDSLLLGVDLIKDREIVLPAYNDAQGITARFNLNLLARMNKELDANFDLEEFTHQPEYTQEEGIARSFLVSTVKQEVYVGSIDTTFSFEAGEKIHTEISRKYSDEIIHEIIRKTDFSIATKISDSKNYFADYILKRN